MNNLKDAFAVLIVLVLLFGFVGCAQHIPEENVTPEVPVDEVTPNVTEPEENGGLIEIEKKPTLASAKELCIDYWDLPEDKLGILLKDVDNSRPKTKDDVDKESLDMGWKEGCFSSFVAGSFKTSQGTLALPFLYSSVSKYSLENIDKVIVTPEELTQDEILFTVPEIGDKAIGYYSVYKIDDFDITNYNIEFIKDDVWVLVSFEILGKPDLSNVVVYYAKKIEEKITEYQNI